MLLPLTFGREAGCSGSAVLIRTGTTGFVVPVCRPALRSTSPRCGAACRPGGADSPGPGGPSNAKVRRPFLRFCAPAMPWARSCSRCGSHTARDSRPRPRRVNQDRGRRSPPPTLPSRAAPETGAGTESTAFFRSSGMFHPDRIAGICPFRGLFASRAGHLSAGLALLSLWPSRSCACVPPVAPVRPEHEALAGEAATVAGPPRAPRPSPLRASVEVRQASTSEGIARSGASFGDKPWRSS